MCTVQVCIVLPPELGDDFKHEFWSKELFLTNSISGLGVKIRLCLYRYILILYQASTPC